MDREPSNPGLPAAIRQLKSAFESELQILAVAERELERLLATGDDRAREEAFAGFRDQLRLLGRTNVTIRDFLKAASDAARLRE